MSADFMRRMLLDAVASWEQLEAQGNPQLKDTGGQIWCGGGVNEEDDYASGVAPGWQSSADEMDIFPYQLTADAAQEGRFIWLGDLPEEIYEAEFRRYAIEWMDHTPPAGLPFSNPPCVFGFRMPDLSSGLLRAEEHNAAVLVGARSSDPNQVVMTIFHVHHHRLIRMGILDWSRVCDGRQRDTLRDRRIAYVADVHSEVFKEAQQGTLGATIFDGMCSVCLSPAVYGAIACSVAPRLAMPVSAKLNKRRTQRGKPALPGYFIIKPVEYKTVIQHMRPAAVPPSLGGSHASPVPHDRRGHYFTRNGKMYWRRASRINAKKEQAGMPVTSTRTHYELRP